MSAGGMATPADPLSAAFARHRQGDFKQAERDYRAVLKKQPHNPDALYLLGMLCLDRDRPGEAAKYLARAVDALGRTARPVDPAWRLTLGTALQRDGKPAAALTAFEAALKSAPANPDALFCRATALQDLGRLEEAAGGYEAVLKIAPKHADAANNLGAIKRDSGESAAAIAAFQRAVASRPNFTEALYNLGHSLADAGRAVEAVSVLRAAADARP
ncbi:MAG: tetratricopeptide repeat protein, partial [Alphaproteobacteria bacterium]|nr:tetratricopeptide repeat protein [Alphaproteobacteria bacterium]